MIVRLADVMFWVAVISCIFIAGNAVLTQITLYSGADRLEIGVIQFGFAAIVYGFGWAIRFILTGKRGLL